MREIQRTNSDWLIFDGRYFDSQKPYTCKVLGCTKRYTDPSSLRKHVKSHSVEEQAQTKIKKEIGIALPTTSPLGTSWGPATPTSVTGDTPTNSSSHFNLASHSTSTLLAAHVGLQAGGTLLNLEEVATATPSPGSAASSLQLLRSGSQQPSIENTGSKGTILSFLTR